MKDVFVLTRYSGEFSDIVGVFSDEQWALDFVGSRRDGGTWQLVTRDVGNFSIWEEIRDASVCGRCGSETPREPTGDKLELERFRLDLAASDLA